MGEQEATVARSRTADTVTWSQDFARRLVVTDLLVLIWVVFGVQIAWLGFDSARLQVSQESSSSLAVSYWMVSAVLIVAWMGVLSIFDTRDYRVVGGGSTEYRNVANATIRLFGAVAIVAYLFKIDVARGYILIALPLGIVVLILSRWIWRQWLAVKRNEGTYSARVMLVGSRASASHLADQLGRHRQEGYLVVGACVPGGQSGTLLPGTQVPVFGDFDSVLDALDAAGADTVAVTGAEDLDSAAGARAELGPRGRPAAPDRGAEPDRHRRSAHPHPAGRRAAAHPRGDAAVRGPQALRQARLRPRRLDSADRAVLARAPRARDHRQGHESRAPCCTGRSASG